MVFPLRAPPHLLTSARLSPELAIPLTSIDIVLPRLSRRGEGLPLSQAHGCGGILLLPAKFSVDNSFNWTCCLLLRGALATGGQPLPDGDLHPIRDSNFAWRTNSTRMNLPAKRARLDPPIRWRYLVVLALAGTQHTG